VIKLGMIGGGMMGEALISRIVVNGAYNGHEILVSDPVEARRQFLTTQYGIRVTAANAEVAIATEVIVLAIKPQIFSSVVPSLATCIPDSSVVVSILAGTPLKQLEAALPGKAVIRAMPNTPAQVGAGITAISAGQHVQADQLARARAVLESVGSVVEVPESMMDAVTGLSGSGPGYLALVIESLADGGVASGLPRAIAMQLAIDTVLGTAKLLKDTGLHPGELKDRVTSPGGTTIAGVAALEEGGLRSALIEAVKAATARSKELGL
jgi:pyrroline-5-carboxylate reductase